MQLYNSKLKLKWRSKNGVLIFAGFHVQNTSFHTVFVSGGMGSLFFNELPETGLPHKTIEMDAWQIFSTCQLSIIHGI